MMSAGEALAHLFAEALDLLGNEASRIAIERVQEAILEGPLPLLASSAGDANGQVADDERNAVPLLVDDAVQ